MERKSLGMSRGRKGGNVNYHLQGLSDLPEPKSSIGKPASCKHLPGSAFPPAQHPDTSLMPIKTNLAQLKSPFTWTERSDPVVGRLTVLFTWGEDLFTLRVSPAPC